MTWNEEEHPRDKYGKFTFRKIGLMDGSGESEENETAVFLRLSTSEYGRVCHAIRTKYKNKIPSENAILFGEYVYRFEYIKSEELILFNNKELIGTGANYEKIKRKG